MEWNCSTGVVCISHNMVCKEHVVCRDGHKEHSGQSTYCSYQGSANQASLVCTDQCFVMVLLGYLGLVCKMQMLDLLKV